MTRRRFVFTEDQLSGMDLDDPGACVLCGEYASGCEPDLEKGPCESCGKNGVYGAQQLLIMGRVDLA